MTQSVPRETVVSPTVCKSLGLNALLDTLQDDRTYSILDLGPALEDNVRFWSQFSCWLHIQDFYHSYRERKASAKPEEEFEEAAFSVLLPFYDEMIFDIILVWDLFNYFDLREIVKLMTRFTVSCSFLLRHGIQEYVFVFK